MHAGGWLTGARGNKTVEQLIGEPWLLLNFFDFQTFHF
jgi:hypothetical protein